MPEARSGNKTSEFLLTVVFIIVVCLDGTDTLNLSTTSLGMIAAVTGVYTGGRSLTKFMASTPPKETVIVRDKETGA